MDSSYPVTLAIDYPDRPLDRLTTLLRLIVAIPILIVAGTVSGGVYQTGRGGTATYYLIAAGGYLFAGPLLMILFRRKYPRWWFDWNRELLRFGTRLTAYMALMDDTYPSTDEEQSVHLGLPYPEGPDALNRWLPLVKWLLAIPHYVILIVLDIAAFVVVVITWFAILFTGRYPNGLFAFVEGVVRWHIRVFSYAILLATDEYPPFRLAV